MLGKANKTPRKRGKERNKDNIITKNKLLVDAKKGEQLATSCKNRICMHPMRGLNLHALGAHLGGRGRRDIYYIPIFYLGSALLCVTSDDEMTKKKKGLKILLFSDIYRIQIV